MAKKSSAEKEVENKDSVSKKDKSDSNKNSKDSKKSLADLKQFFREALSELKKIHWPNRKQVTGETIVVLITVTFLTLLVMFFDNVITLLFNYIFEV